MPVSVGDSLPEAICTVMTDNGPSSLDLNKMAAGKKVVLFGVPGAFTPTCHGNHLPGFLEHADALKAKGVDEIAVVSVNDPFVMDQWEKASNTDGKIRFLADGAAEFIKSIGMDLDLSDFGMGVRSRRFSMLLDDGKVAVLNIEDSPKDAVKSGAAALLEAL